MALDAASFQHYVLSLNESTATVDASGMAMPAKIPLSVPAAGIKRIRLFVLTPVGYEIRPLEHSENEFKGWLDFSGLSFIRYYFQVETEEGRIFESQLYSIRWPLDSKREEQIRQSLAELESLTALLSQLERQLAYLKIGDPTKYKERALEEKKFALNALASTTLEYSRLLNEVESGLKALRQRTAQMAEPQRVEIERFIASQIEPALREAK